jgi:hypothetical protein
MELQSIFYAFLLGARPFCKLLYILYVSFRYRIFITDLFRDVQCRTFAIVASQPFTVIAVRMMAQFVGGEHKYW